MISMRALECLVTIVEQGSLTQAAAVLHMSQPALSHQIAAIERELGTPVIERLPRGVRPTVAGLATAAEARIALTAADRAVMAGRRAAAGTGGRIRIACAETMTAWVLVPVLRSWRRRCPDVELDLKEYTSADRMLEVLRAGGTDITVGPRPTRAEEHTELLGREEIVIVASPEHRFARLDAVPLAELAGEPLVHYNPGNGFGVWVDQFAAQRGVVLPQPTLRTGSPRTAAQLAAAGMGVTLVPFSALTPLPGATIRPLDPPELRDVIVLVAAPHDDLLRRFVGDLKRRGLPDSRLSPPRPRSRPALAAISLSEGTPPMGLAWQQGPLAPGAIGRFLVPDPLPDRLLFAEPLRRRLRVRFGGAEIADSEDVVLLHEPGRYPVAYFPADAITEGVLHPGQHTTRHPDLGATSWYTVRAGGHAKPRAAWQHTELPGYAGELKGRVAFAWRAMDAFYEEDERILGHAADAYHRIDIRRASRHLVVRHQARVIADTTRPLALYESGFAPRWYVPRAGIDESALTPAQGQTFCPYKGLCSYYDIAGARRAAWSYQDAWSEVRRISGLVSFEPDKVEVHLDGTLLRLEPGQAVVPHGPDRDLTLDEATAG